MLSLDELAEQEASGQTEIPSVEMSLPEENEAEIIRQFCNTLDGKDREIFQLKAKGKTQREIANLLGYKSQGAVSKRLHRIEKQFREFLRERT